MTDTQIIEYLRTSQHGSAIKHLYKMLPDAKKYIVANSGSIEDANDIFQDALVILYRKVNDQNLELTVSLKTYFLSIIKNCWRSELRQRGKFSATELPAEIPDFPVDEEEYFIKAKKAFSILGDKCKQLLIEFYFKKRSFKEIATALGFNDEKTAKNQKYRCLQKAKEHYITLSK